MYTGELFVHCRSVNPVRIPHLAPDLAISDLPGRRFKWSEFGNTKEIAKGGFSAVFSATLGSSRYAVKQYVTIRHDVQFAQMQHLLTILPQMGHLSAWSGCHSRPGNGQLDVALF